MLVRCPQCQYANQVEADATKPRIVCARCATVISVEFLSNPSVPPAFESPVSEVPVADVWAEERPPSEPSFMKTPESPLDLDSLLDAPGEAAPVPPLVPPPPVMQTAVPPLTASSDSSWDGDEILEIPRAAMEDEAQADPLAVEDLLAAPPLAATQSEITEPLLTEAEPVLETTTSDVWSAPLDERGEAAVPPAVAFGENPPTPFPSGEYAEAAPETPSTPERPSVFAQDSYTRKASNTFVMATPDSSNKGNLAKAFLIAALVFLLLGVAYVGLSGFVKDWLARRNQQAAVTPESAASNAGSAAPSVAPSAAAKTGTETNDKKASPSASASVAASVKPSASPSATATPAANQNAASKPTPAPPQTGTSGHAVGSSDGSLTLQIGSYKTAGEAQARVAKLKAAGVEGRVVKADVPGKGTWYRVHTGRFTSEADAAKRANELRAKGATRDFIVTGYQNE